MAIDKSLISGNTDMLILKLLEKQDMYGYQMIEELAKVPKIMALANEQADTMATMWSTITGYAEEFWMDLTGAGEETGVVTLWSQLKDILKDIRDGGEKLLLH